MIRNILLSFLILINQFFLFKSYNKTWTKQFGTPAIDEAYSVTMDSNNFVYVAGSTTGNLDGFNNAGEEDAFLMKFDSAGNKTWSKLFGSSEYDRAYSVTTDSNNFVYVAGVTTGSLDGNKNAGLWDAFLRKFDSEGNKIWTKQYGSLAADQANSVTTDSNNFVYVTGLTLGSRDGIDVFLIKYDSDGNRRWTNEFGTSVLDWTSSVTTDSNNFVYVAGWTRGSLHGNINTNPNTNTTDTFLVKFDSTGYRLWTKQFGSERDVNANSVTTDSNNFVYVAGDTEGSLDGNTNAGSSDAFVVKFDSEGNKIWTRQFGTSSRDQANSVTTDSNNFVYVAGVTEGSLDGNKNAGLSDAFVVKFDSAGNKIWTKQFGTPGEEKAESVMTDSNNFVYVAGRTTGSRDGRTNAGVADAFLVKFDPENIFCKESCSDCTSIDQVKCKNNNTNIFFANSFDFRQNFMFSLLTIIYTIVIFFA